MAMKNLYDLPCNIAQTLNIIGDKWTLLILRQIMMGQDTYSKMQQKLEGIPSNLLSNRLKCLEDDGLITSNLYQAHPPRYRYVLTDSGKDLSDVFNSIILWCERNLKKCHRKLIHSECGQKFKMTYYCPECDKNISQDDIIMTEPDKTS
jgi:DNA-binding HxlR family transcriptional regulator